MATKGKIIVGVHGQNCQCFYPSSSPTSPKRQVGDESIFSSATNIVAMQPQSSSSLPCEDQPSSPTTTRELTNNNTVYTDLDDAAVAEMQTVNWEDSGARVDATMVAAAVIINQPGNENGKNDNIGHTDFSDESTATRETSSVDVVAADYHHNHQHSATNNITTSSGTIMRSLPSLATDPKGSYIRVMFEELNSLPWLRVDVHIPTLRAHENIILKGVDPLVMSELVDHVIDHFIW
jgi:hypothetical protein